MLIGISYIAIICNLWGICWTHPGLYRSKEGTRVPPLKGYMYMIVQYTYLITSTVQMCNSNRNRDMWANVCEDNYECDSVRESWANCSRGVLIYDRKAVLFHRLSVQIVESSSPAFAAVVAAPIQKLCPAKWWSGTPATMRASLTLAIKYGWVNGSPLVWIKKGPLEAPLCAMYNSTAATGQRRS